MEKKNAMQVEKNLSDKTITVTRDFAAEPALVWRAWTEKELLEQWWAPKPWRAESKDMDFREGGHWQYAMVSPEGERHWARVDFKTITPITHFTAKDSFCDENGNIVSDPPGMDWDNTFSPNNGGTRVLIRLSFASEPDMKKILEMGFEEGFAAALGNLDEYLAKR